MISYFFVDDNGNSFEVGLDSTVGDSGHTLRYLMMEANSTSSKSSMNYKSYGTVYRIH